LNFIQFKGSSMSDASKNSAAENTETDEGIAAVKMMTQFNLAEAFQKASKETKRSSFALSLDLAKASLGKAKLSQDEFFRYRIYDKENLSIDERSAFIGQIAVNMANHSINKAMTSTNIVDQKIVYCAALRGLGLKAPVLQAMVRTNQRETAFRTISSVEEFAKFMRTEARFPLFGKPNNGSLSQGASSFDRYDETADKLIDIAGEKVDPEQFAAEVFKEFGDRGYMIEERVIPHPELQEVSGQTVGTVRFFSLDDGTGPKPIYAVWKIPSFNAVADNLWRDGNLVGEIDMETGEVLTVRSSGVDGETTYESHPDSGARLIGRIMPDWEEAKSTVRRAAAMTPHILGIGFDLALSVDGPLIIEGNTLPNHGLYQAATGRGFMSEEMSNAVKRASDHSQTLIDKQKNSVKAHIDDVKRRKKATSAANLSAGMKTAVRSQPHECADMHDKPQ